MGEQLYDKKEIKRPRDVNSVTNPNPEKHLQKITRVGPVSANTLEAAFNQWETGHGGFVRSKELKVKESIPYMQEEMGSGSKTTDVISKDATHHQPSGESDPSQLSHYQEMKKQIQGEVRKRILENMARNPSLIKNTIEELRKEKVDYTLINKFEKLRKYLEEIKSDPGKAIDMFDNIKFKDMNYEIKKVYGKLLMNAYQAKNMRGAEESTSKTQKLELPAEVKMLLEQTPSSQRVSRRFFQEFLRSKFEEYGQLSRERQELDMQMGRIELLTGNLEDKYEKREIPIDQYERQKYIYDDIYKDKNLLYCEKEYEVNELEKFLSSCSRRLVEIYDEFSTCNDDVEYPTLKLSGDKLTALAEEGGLLWRIFSDPRDQSQAEYPLYEQVSKLLYYFNPKDSGDKITQFDSHKYDKIKNEKEAINILFDLKEWGKYSNNRQHLSESMKEFFKYLEDHITIDKAIDTFEQIYKNAENDPATELIWKNRERFQMLSSDVDIRKYLLDYDAYLSQKEEARKYLDDIKTRKNSPIKAGIAEILYKGPKQYIELQLLWEKLRSQSRKVEERIKGPLEVKDQFEEIRSGGYSEQLHYPTNEDAYTCLPSDHAYAVFDGLGGRKDGHVPSSIAKETFEAEMENFDREISKKVKEKGFSIKESAEEFMRNMVVNINSSILKKTIGVYQNDDMPMTTMTALKIVETETEKIAVIANVGDSRCYRIRINGEKPTIEQLTLDNATSENLNNENAKKLQELMASLETFGRGYLKQRLPEFRGLIDTKAIRARIAARDAEFQQRGRKKRERPEMSDDDLVLHEVERRIRKRHEVLHALGNINGIKDPAVYTYKVEPGDIYVLPTDGVHDTYMDKEILGSSIKVIKNPHDERESIILCPIEANEVAKAIVAAASKKALSEEDPNGRGKPDDTTVVVALVKDEHNIKDNSELITASSSYSHNEIDKIADRLKDKLRVAENSKVIDAVDQFICKNIDIVVHNSSNSHSNSPDDLQVVSYLEQFQTYLKEIRDEASEAQIMVNLREMKKGVDARPLDRKGSVIDTAWKGLLNGWTVEQMNKYVENQAYIEEIIKNIKANPQAIETVKEFIDGRIVILRNSNSDNDQEDTRYLKEINTNLDKIKNDASEEQVMNVLMAMKKEVDARPLGRKAIMTEVALEGLLADSTRDEVEEDMEEQMEIYDVIKNVQENSQLIGTIQDYIKQVLDMSQFKDQEDSDYLNNFKTDLEEIRNETSEEQRVVKLREMKNKVDTRPPDWKGSVMERAWLGLLHGWQNDVEVYIEEQADISCINENIKENPQVIETVQSFINKQIDTLRKDNVKSDDISYLEMFNDNLEEIGNEVSEKQIMGILMTMKDVVDIKSIKTVRFAIGAAWEGLLKDPTTTVKQMEEYMYELIDIDDINENIKENPQLIETVQEYINILLGELSFVDEGDRRCLEEFNARLGEIGNETIDEERMLDLRFMKNEFDAEFDAEFIDWKVLVFKKAWGGLIDNWTPNQMNEDIDEQKNIYEIINTINENPQVIENVQRFIEEHRENVQRFIEEHRDTLVERNDPNSSDEVTSDDLEYGEYLGQFNTCLCTIKESIEEENSIFGVIMDEMRDQTYKKRVMGNLMAMKNEVDDSSLEAKEFVIEAAWEGLQNAWTVEEMDKYMDMQLDMHDIIEKINEENSQVIETVQQFIGEHRDTLVGKNDSNFPDNVISDDLENIGYLKQFNNCLNEIRDTKYKGEEGKIEKEVAEEEIMNNLMTMKKEFDDKYLESKEFVIQAAWEGLKGKMGLNEMKKYVSDQMEVVVEEEENLDMETN